MVLLAPARSTIGSGMTVQFAHPLLLLVIVPVLALGLGMRLTLGRPSSPRAPLWAALYVGSVVLVALALPAAGAHSSRPVTVLVIDRSASIDASMRQTEDRWAAEVARGACPQPCRIISFAATPATVRPAQRPSTRADRRRWDRISGPRSRSGWPVCPAVAGSSSCPMAGHQPDDAAPDRRRADQARLDRPGRRV